MRGHLVDACMIHVHAPLQRAIKASFALPRSGSRVAQQQRTKRHKRGGEAQELAAWQACKATRAQLVVVSVAEAARDSLPASVAYYLVQPPPCHRASQPSTPMHATSYNCQHCVGGRCLQSFPGMYARMKFSPSQLVGATTLTPVCA